MRALRTDLAMEAAGGSDMPGVRVSSWDRDGVTVTEVIIEREEGARLVGKPLGHYVTLEYAGLPLDAQMRSGIAAMLGEEISRLLPPGDAPALVIGLGNRFVTPDALGPGAVERVLVTRHLFREKPERVDERMGSVCALAPGVLGVTGIETMEVARAVVESVKPRAVICVDALAARAIKRVGGVIQLTDSGIQPGSGVGNRRMTLSEDTLGAKVLAIGVPTVIYAATVARDAFEILSGEADTPEREKTLDAMTDELLSGAMREMIVTPREVDELVSDAAGMVALGINRALHPGLGERDIQAMMG